MAGPTQGEVYDGYRFLGGDPKDQNNWEQAAPVAAPEYGNGAQKLPNGDIVRYGPRGGLTVLQQGGGDGVGKLTEGQGKSIQYGLMMRGAEEDYQRARQEGYDPASLRNQAAAVAGLIPFDGDYFGRLIRDDVSDRGRQAELRWAEGNLRQLTGAAATNPEIARVAAINFDRGNDQLSDQRYRTRSETYKGTRFAAGPGASALGDYPDAPGRLAVDEKTGLPDYAGIASTVQGVDGGYDIGLDGRPVAPAPQTPTPGSSPDTAIDIESGISPDEILALLQKGGWVRRGDGEPFEATASRGTPEQGAQSLRPGLNLNPAAMPEEVVAERRDGSDLMRRIDAGVRGAADTLTFGLADELAAGANTVLPLDPGARSGFQDGFGSAFRNNLNIQRAVDRADAQDVPVSRGAGQVAGALVPAGAVVRGAGMGGRALATAPNALRAAAAGGAYGGAYGFGSAEGNALQRVPEAAVGGGVGAVTGAVGAPVAGFIGRRVAAPVGNALQAGNRFLGRQVGRAGEKLNVPGAAALTERAQPNALRSGLNRFADRMGPQRVNALSGRVDEQTGLGIDATAVDALDDASLGRVRALATRDTPARDQAVRFAEGRRERLPSRVRRIASEEVSSDARPTQAVMDDLAKARRANAGAINDFGGDMVALDDNAIQALRSDLAQSAVQAAIRRAQGSIDPAERDAANRLASLADTVRDNPAGARLSVREVQDISAALRNAADGAFRSNAPADGPVLANLGKAVRDAGRNSSEGYRKWLGQYADDSDLLEAATTGRNFVSVSTDPVSARSTDAFVGRAAGATPGELTVQRQAAGQAMQAAGSNPTTARGVLTNLAYDDDQYRRAASLGLDADRLRARAGTELRSVTQAQRASPRVGSETSTNAQDAGGAAGLSIGDLANPIRAAAGVALNRIRSRGFNDQEAQAIVEAVIDPARTQEVIGFLAQRMTKREARNLQRVIRKQVTTGLLSGQQPSA
jgi:hypothetical protein